MLQGLLIALLNLDAIIEMIRNAADTPTTRQELMYSYGLSGASGCDFADATAASDCLKQKNSPGTRGYKRKLLTYKISWHDAIASWKLLRRK